MLFAFIGARLSNLGSCRILRFMAHFEGFQAIEAMQESSAAAGWESEYRQMEAGHFEAQTVFQPVGSSSLVCETANRRLDIAARTPDDAVTILVPITGTDVLINGRRLTDERMMILAPDIDFHAGSKSGDEVWSVHLDAEVLSSTFVQAVKDTVVVDGKCDVLKQLRELIRYSIGEPDVAALAHSEARFSDLAEELMLDDSIKRSGDRYHRRRKRQALSRALEYVEEHLSGPIRIGQIAEWAGVSRSTLERLFKREFQQRPADYVRIRRLNAVRVALKRGLQEDATIADVATTHGFTHPGRFSSAYREHFGRLPSEDATRL